MDMCSVTFSTSTLNLFAQFLSQATIAPVGDDFMEIAQRLDTARTELQLALRDDPAER